ncbi:SDR family NAD(P)-dependent oxidoreductase [Nocardia sp. NPDC051911]|uniref:SDR family NAD(P)-dependent oxidoreductase n=1 Tax=Nocardia sp. NPDC051911 TaxID=3154648 RepID=UPI00342FE3A6
MTRDRVAGKVVIVTGAGQGQGAAEARLLAAEGAAVVALDLTEKPVEELPGIDYRQLDITEADGWSALAADLPQGIRTGRRTRRERRHHLASAPGRPRPGRPHSRPRRQHPRHAAEHPVCAASDAR